MRATGRWRAGRDHASRLHRADARMHLGVMTGGKSWADWVAHQGDPAELAAWKASLHHTVARRLYRSDTHTDARMHLGGIGAGNFELGVDGQITTWQLFNTLRDGYVPLLFAR